MGYQWLVLCCLPEMRWMPHSSQGSKFSFAVLLVWSGASCGIFVTGVLGEAGVWYFLPVLPASHFHSSFAVNPEYFFLYMSMRGNFKCCVEIVSNLSEKSIASSMWMGPCHCEEFIRFVGSAGKTARMETQRIWAKYFPTLSSRGMNCMISEACCQSYTRGICFFSLNAGIESHQLHYYSTLCKTCCHSV